MFTETAAKLTLQLDHSMGADLTSEAMSIEDQAKEIVRLKNPRCKGFAAETEVFLNGQLVKVGFTDVEGCDDQEFVYFSEGKPRHIRFAIEAINLSKAEADPAKGTAGLDL